MSDQPKKEGELLLRGDVGIKWKRGVGQFPEPTPPVKPTDMEGMKVPVYMYLDEEKISFSSALAPEQNDGNNQVQITKIPKKPIKFYVKVNGGGGSSHHDDYSYHSPPWEDGTTSSSPPYSQQIAEDTSSGGESSPGATARDPSGSSYPSGPNESAMTAITNAPTQQVQYGGAPPASPGLSQRFNIFPRRLALNPIALRTFRKLRHVTNIEVELVLRPEVVPTAGESIEMNLIIIPMVGMEAPSAVYRSAFKIDETWDLNWTRLVIPFRGFDASGDYPVTYGLERRCDVTPNFDTEVWVMETIIRGVN